MDAQRSASVVTKFILTGAEQNAESEAEAAALGDVLFTDDKLSGYRSIVHKTYFVLAHVVCAAPAQALSPIPNCSPSPSPSPGFKPYLQVLDLSL